MKRNIILTYLFSMLFYFYMDLALWTIYLTDKKGFSIVDLGIFQAVFVITKLLFEVPSGIFSDKVGRVRTLIISTIAVIFSNLFMIVGNGILPMFTAYILFGISLAFVSGTLEAFLYDSLKAEGLEDKYKKINTNLYFLTMVSFSIAMAIGGFVSYSDMRLMYVGNMLVEVVALILCLFMIEPPIVSRTANSVGKIVKDSVFALKNSPILIYLIAFITITDALSNNVWHLSQKLLSINGLSNMSITIESILTTLACGFAAQAGYYLESRLGRMAGSIFTISILTVPLLVLGSTKNIYFMLIALTMTTISISFASPIFSSYINSEVDSSYRATLLSIQSFVASIFALVFLSTLAATGNIAKAFVSLGAAAIPVYMFLLHKINTHKAAANPIILQNNQETSL